MISANNISLRVGKKALFEEEWNSRGGDKLTQALDEAYQAKK